MITRMILWEKQSRQLEKAFKQANIEYTLIDQFVYSFFYEERQIVVFITTKRWCTSKGLPNLSGSIERDYDKFVRTFPALFSKQKNRVPYSHR